MGTSTMVLNIPPELTDKIICHVPRHDIATLNACAASGRQCTTTSRARAFAFIRIGRSQLHRLHSILTSTTSPCTFKQQVRTLAVGHPMQQLPGTEDSTLLFYTLGSFPNLQSLTLISWFGEAFPLGRSNITFPSIPQLTSLNVSGIQFDDEAMLLRFICAYQSLQTLEITGVSFVRPDASIPPLRLPKGLRSLTLDAEERECQNLVAWLAFYPRVIKTHLGDPETSNISTSLLPPISSLRVRNVSNKTAAPLYELLTALGNSLVDFSIYFKPGAEDAENLFQNHPLLTSVENLRMLTYNTTPIARIGTVTIDL